ncbi:hypothetical protein PPACK8108_LOCUS21206 [Phakopsora pachyrhizi]|uniref:Uncharacterized protein n=1 Tax=Phakopsora pachyrhizi TaxID=170000 RepID=A0AAV0BJC3_PHAPC|nr:hypothetical protein PPACK8108_LOCUS21206 [Phakopsora pachyrhizi]
MAQSPKTTLSNRSRLISTGGLTPSNDKLHSQLPTFISSENQLKHVTCLETNPQLSNIATPDSLIDFSFARQNSQPLRLSQDSTGASLSSVTTAFSLSDYRRDSIALTENSLSNSPNSKIRVYLEQARHGLPSPTPSPRKLPMSKSEVLHVKKLVNDYISREPQAQKRRTQAMALSNKMSASPVMNCFLASPSPRGNPKRKSDGNNHRDTIYSRINTFKGSIESQTRLLVQENGNLENKLEQAEAQVLQLLEELKKLCSLLVTGGSDMMPLPLCQDVDALQVMGTKLNRDINFVAKLRLTKPPATRSIGSPTIKQLAQNLTKSVPHKRCDQ